MKIRDSLVDILLEIDKDKYRDFVIYYSKDKLLCVKMLKVLHGMLIASILCCKKFRKDIKIIVHKVNPCAIHLINKIINGKQYMLT